MNDTPDELKTALEQIEDNTPWTVRDWGLSMSDTRATTVDLVLKYDGEPATGLKAAVKEEINANKSGDGALIGAVISNVVENHDDATPEDVRDAIDNLKQTGEVYEPNLDRLRAA